MRHPAAPLLLGLVTLGVYQIVWYYKVNREMRDYGAALGDQPLASSSPAMSVLAVTIGSWIVVPSIVSWVNTVKRVQEVQRVANLKQVQGLMVFLLAIVTVGIALPIIVQRELNRVWRSYAGSARPEELLVGALAVDGAPHAGMAASGSRYGGH